MEPITPKALAQKSLSLFDEFKRFAFKGNVFDLAVGVIIGTAFAKIIDSFVKDLIMPLINVLIPGQGSYVDWVWRINNKEVPVGRFLGEVANFLIVAAVLFVFVVKFLGWVMRSRREDAAKPLTKDQELLAEIRDLLKKQTGEAGAPVEKA